MSATYLVVLGDRDAIRWVLHEQRMAFPATPRPEITALDVGDELFLYATRGAWRNPTRDRGRILGHGWVASPVRRLETTFELASMTFHSECGLRLDGVVPYPGGLELQPLVDRLDAFPRADVWSAYLRRPLVRLSSGDRDELTRLLRPLMVPRETAISTYVDSAAKRTVGRSR